MALGVTRCLLYVIISLMGSTWFAKGELTMPKARLLDYLFKEYGDLQIRPVLVRNTTIEVGLTTKPAALVQFRELDQLVVIQSNYYMTWTDEVLRWDPSAHEGIQEVGLDCFNIWQPDLTVPETVGDTFDALHNNRCMVSYTGRVDWHFIGVTTTYCKLLVRYFPYDVQHCDLSFTSWNFNEESLRFYYYNQTSNKVYSANGAWALRKVAVKENPIYYCSDRKCPPYSKITFTIELDRTMQTFFALNIFVPCVLLSVLNIFVFFIPIEAGDKLGFIMTNALSLILFQQLVAAMLPPSGDDTPLISMHMFYMIMAGCLAIIWEIVVLNFYYRVGPYPKMLYKLLSIRFCHRCINFDDAKPGDKTDDQDDKHHQASDAHNVSEGNSNNNADPSGESSQCGESSGTLRRDGYNSLRRGEGSTSTLRRKVNPHTLVCSNCGYKNKTTITSTVITPLDLHAVNLQTMDHTVMWQQTAFLLDRMMAYTMTAYTLIVYFILFYGYGSYVPEEYRSSASE